MSKFLHLTVLSALIAVPTPAQERPDSLKKAVVEKEKPTYYQVGDTVPADLQMTTLYGKTLTMGDFRGKVVLLSFWCITCPYMKDAEPKLMQIQEDFADKDVADKDVVVIGINPNRTELGDRPDWTKIREASANKAEFVAPYPKLVAHVEEHGVAFPIVADHGNVIADRFKAQTTPHCFVIDPKGVVRYDGALDDDPRGRKETPTHYVRDALTAVLAGDKPAVENSKPYGCTIKREPKPKNEAEPRAGRRGRSDG